MVKTNNCLILAAAEIADYQATKSAIQQLGQQDFFIICADAGYYHAEKLGYIPDLVIGDFDSSETELNASCEVIRFLPEKDDTDTMLAIKEGMKRGYRNFVIAGGLGGRLDHTFANISSLAYLAKHECKGALIDAFIQARMFSPGSYIIPRQPGKKLSSFAFSGPVTGLCEKGVKYPLEDYTLDSNFPLGVSNVIVESQAEISFSSGLLLIIEE